MSFAEKTLHVKDMAALYIQTAEQYGHSAIFVQPYAQPDSNDLSVTQWLLEEIREQSGDQYFLMLHGDITCGIPNGDEMMAMAVQMYEEPEKIHEASKRDLNKMTAVAQKLDQMGHLVDGFGLCSDYCFNINPFFTEEQFSEFVVPYLKEIIDVYRSLGYYSIKHTDGNVIPILHLLAECHPDAIHSLDPQGGVSLPEARKIVGKDICLVGNVNCGLLQTGTDEECEKDVLRSLREGMENGRGYIFSTSNCVYTGMPLTRYEKMIELWRRYGHYPEA